MIRNILERSNEEKIDVVHSREIIGDVIMVKLKDPTKGNSDLIADHQLTLLSL